MKDLLDRFTFVKWDRVIPDVGACLIYGWIEREKDSYKDFVILSIDILHMQIMECTTSSAKYSKEISKLCGFPEEEHTDCVKLADYLKLIGE